MELETLTLGPLAAHCYLASERAGGPLVVIDPGAQPEHLLSQIAGRPVQGILLTHAHFDHFGALEAVRRATGAPVYLGCEEADWLHNTSLSGPFWPGLEPPAATADAEQLLPAQVQSMELAGLHIEVRPTPGHDPGGRSYYVPEHQAVFTGDTLFAGSIGRSDLPGGDVERLLESIWEQLLILPDETAVYPGHGPSSTIGQERKGNPFLWRL